MFRIRLALLPLVVSLAPATSLAEDAPKASEIEESAAGAAGEEEPGAVSDTGEQRRTLAERIPSVTRRAFVKAGRVEVFPTVGLSLNDPFYDHVVGSLGVSVHLGESLALGITGDYYQSLETAVPVQGGQGSPTLDITRPLYAGRVELAWAPFYGKVSLFAENVLHFDLYLIAGAGMLERSRGERTVTGVVGIGEHFFLNDWLGLRVEIRDNIFMLDRQPTGMPAQENLHNLLTAVVGLCFYVPPSFEHEQL